MGKDTLILRIGDRCKSGKLCKSNKEENQTTYLTKKLSTHEKYFYHRLVHIFLITIKNCVHEKIQAYELYHQFRYLYSACFSNNN